jgi:hypothetical protein
MMDTLPAGTRRTPAGAEAGDELTILNSLFSELGLTIRQ